MSIQFPEFIGRDSQLGAINNSISRQDQTVVVNIAGAGGVGKTTILRKIRDNFKSDPNKLLTEIVDFFHTAHRIESWVLEQVVALCPNEFPTYRKAMKEMATLDPLPRLYQEQEAREDFIRDYNLIAKNHRLILLFDTVELVQETPLLEFILDLATKLKNTVLVLAGRYNDDRRLVERLHANFGLDQVLTFRLEGFTREEADLYIENTVAVRFKEVHADLRQNIYLLSEGRPIKIALALDWLDRGIPLMAEVTHMQPAVLAEMPQEELTDLQNQFEYALMSGIRQLVSPVDEVVLYMAHLHKRFNRQMLEFFFPNQDSKHLITQLKELPFVKYMNDDYFVLHDEMARFVIQRVWDAVEDPDKTLRYELSEQVCDYYTQALKEFPAWPDCTEQQRVTIWSYRVEQLYYQLYADFEAGYYVFEQLYEELVSNYRHSLAALAVDFLREFKNEASFSKLVQSITSGYYAGGVLLARQKFDDAVIVLLAGKEQTIETIAQLDLSSATSLDKHLSERLYRVYNQLGFCYRSLGNWEQAIDHFNKSLELALEMVEKAGPQEVLMKHIAETLNNLANVYRLVGEFDRGRLLCQTSILLRQTWTPQQVANSQYVMAMTLWEMGGTAEAMRYLRQAEQTCPPENEAMQALIKKQRAYILFRAGWPDQAVPLLKEAETIFSQRGQFSDVADALNMLSRIFRQYPKVVKAQLGDRDHLELSEEYVNEAHRLAERIGDKFRQAECHLTKAFHYYYCSQHYPNQSQTYRQKALAHWQAGIKLAEDRYYRFFSQYSQVRGHIAFAESDYESAFEYYVQQCKQATHFKRATFERSVDNLGERLRELSKKDSGLTKQYIRQIINIWQQESELRTIYSELLEEVREIRNAIEEQEALKQLRTSYNRAILAGEWKEALTYCDNILEIPSLYSDISRAGIILDKIRAAHRLGDLPTARRLSKVVLEIGQQLQNFSLIGQGNLYLALILWDTTSTAEAAEHLESAEAAFKKVNDEIGLLKTERLRYYIQHRTGFFKAPKEQLEIVAQGFEKHGLDSELADIWNVLSRITRTDPENPNPEPAHRYAEQALAKAKQVGDSYQIGECNLSLAIAAYREKNYDEVLNLCEVGLNVLSLQTHLLRSVYHGMQGVTLFDLGQQAQDRQQQTQYWDQAFDAYILELIEATLSKPIRLIRALDLIYPALMHLPSLEATQKYSDRIKDAWQRNQLVERFPTVIHMCEEAVRYRPYIDVSENEQGA